MLVESCRVIPLGVEACLVPVFLLFNYDLVISGNGRAIAGDDGLLALDDTLLTGASLFALS